MCSYSFDDFELFIVLLTDQKVARTRLVFNGEAEYIVIQGLLQLVNDGRRSRYKLWRKDCDGLWFNCLALRWCFLFSAWRLCRIYFRRFLSSIILLSIWISDTCHKSICFVEAREITSHGEGRGEKVLAMDTWTHTVVNKELHHNINGSVRTEWNIFINSALLISIMIH